MAWAGIKKKMFQKREKMGPQQQAEAAKIRQDSEAFRVKVDNFRTLFKKKAPFGVRSSAGLLVSVKRARFAQRSHD